MTWTSNRRGDTAERGGTHGHRPDSETHRPASQSLNDYRWHESPYGTGTGSAGKHLHGLPAIRTRPGGSSIAAQVGLPVVYCGEKLDSAIALIYWWKTLSWWR